MIKVIEYGNIPKAIREGNLKAMSVLSAKVVAEAKTHAPVDLGELRNSIMAKVGKNIEHGFNDGCGKAAESKISERPASNEAYVGTNLYYAPYQEFGTRDIPAHPFLRPAILIHANGYSVSAAVKRAQLESVRKERHKRKRTRVYK